MKLINATLCLSLAAGLMTVAPAVQAEEQLAASMCDYVKADDKNRFRKLLSDNRLRLRNIYDGVVCDGLPLIRFAVKSNAAGAGEFIVKQLPAAQITASGDIGWAEANHAGSPLIAVLKARAGGGNSKNEFWIKPCTARLFAFSGNEFEIVRYRNRCYR